MNFNIKLKSFFLAALAIVALPGSTATPRAKGNLCGAAVGGQSCSTTDCRNDEGCTTMLYNHVEGDTSFQCFSYSGVCTLRNNDFMNTNPNNCKGDTLYLWDEPGDIGWAVNSWRSYVQRYGAELNEFRNRGGVITSPMWRTPGAGTKSIQFLEQCGDVCIDPSSNGYIGALAGNYFAPAGDTAEGSAEFNINDMREATSKYPNLLVYVTNWSTNNCKDAFCQYQSMKASKKMLDIGWR
mmetsp:Transcript_17995/g.18207  ORF Transcript_17995/g.18207 Transcript_17995/m.18207 type:complete len:239 (+) Transcript_17995:50-766(+)